MSLGSKFLQIKYEFCEGMYCANDTEFGLWALNKMISFGYFHTYTDFKDLDTPIKVQYTNLITESLLSNTDKLKLIEANIYLTANEVEITDEISGNPFSNEPDRRYNFFQVEDIQKNLEEYNPYYPASGPFTASIGLSQKIKSQSRSVYNLITFISDIGGFMGSLQVITSIIMNVIYLPIVFEISLLK